MNMMPNTDKPGLTLTAFSIRTRNISTPRYREYLMSNEALAKTYGVPLYRL